MNEAMREESVGLLFDVDARSTSRSRRPGHRAVHVSQMLGAMSGAGAATAASRTDAVPPPG